MIDATFTGEVDRIIKALAEHSVQSIESSAANSMKSSWTSIR